MSFPITFQHVLLFACYPESFSVIYNQRPPAETPTYRIVSLKSRALCSQYQWRTKGTWSEIWSLWVVEIGIAVIKDSTCWNTGISGTLGFVGISSRVFDVLEKGSQMLILSVLLIWQGLTVSWPTFSCSWLLCVSRVIAHLLRVVVILSWEQRSMTRILVV